MYRLGPVPQPSLAGQPMGMPAVVSAEERRGPAGPDVVGRSPARHQPPHPH